MSAESWQPIPYSDYSVSSGGKVRNDRTGYILAESPDKDGYPRASLMIGNARKTLKVHRLVAFAFLGEAPPGKPHVAHKDGNPKNNHFSNLRWTDVAENNRDKARHGTQTRGEDQHLSKLDAHIVRLIRSMADMGVSQREIAKAVGVTKSNVQFVVHRKTWKHVT